MLGKPSERMVTIRHGGQTLFAAPRVELQRAWSATSYHMRALRDHAECARQEYDLILDERDRGLVARPTFNLNEDIAAPYIGGARPRLAVLREQGVNGHMEMAAAFDRAGFAAVDIHMSDILGGRADLADFAGLAACGGFSYGDVLGAGQGWAKSILFNARARDAFAAFFARPDSFALGVCNGCQMLAAIKSLIPGAEDWPRFAGNISERFESRLVLTGVQDNPCVLTRGMADSILPIVVAHAQGRAVFDHPRQLTALQQNRQIVLRYVDADNNATQRYPNNPNGSPAGAAGFTTPDGRFTILMPHPERLFRTTQFSWHPDDWQEDGPWLRLFRNARVFVG